MTQSLPATSCNTRRGVITCLVVAPRRRFAAALLALTLTWLVAMSASAQTKVVVGDISGKGGGQVRAAIARALQQHDELQLVSSAAVSKAESRLGVEATGRDRVSVSRELGVAAWIEGEVGKSKRGVDVTLQVIAGASGETMTVMSYESKKPKGLAELAGDSVWSDLGTLLMSAQAPGAAPAQTGQQPEPVAERPQANRRPVREEQAARDEDEDDDKESENGEEAAKEEAEPEEEPSQGDETHPSPLDVGLGVVAFTRHLKYNDDLSGLSSYRLDLGPSIGLQAHWYPVAHFDSGALANIGLDLRARMMFAVDTGLDDQTFSTSSHAFGIGLRGRLPLGEHELGAVIGYANQTFAIASAKTDAGVVDPGIPSASYGFLRLGLEARLVFGAVHVGAAAAILPVLSTGEVERWFPRSSALGLEGQLSVGYALSRSLELEAAFGMQRIALSMNPELDDVDLGRPIAGGAVDEMLFGTLGACFYLGR